jgi:predicted DNA-binding ribbon-helix-helix protein
MKSSQLKRSIVLDGRKTSISLEDSFWTGLKEIADFQQVTPSELISAINATRKESNLASATRIFVLEHFQNKHKSAGLPLSNDSATRSDKSRSPEAWRGFAKRG